MRKTMPHYFVEEPRFGIESLPINQPNILQGKKRLEKKYINQKNGPEVHFKNKPSPPFPLPLKRGPFFVKLGIFNKLTVNASISWPSSPSVLDKFNK